MIDARYSKAQVEIIAPRATTTHNLNDEHFTIKMVDPICCKCE